MHKDEGSLCKLNSGRSGSVRSNRSRLALPTLHPIHKDPGRETSAKPGAPLDTEQFSKLAAVPPKAE